jgi:hypothetical protein
MEAASNCYRTGQCLRLTATATMAATSRMVRFLLLTATATTAAISRTVLFLRPTETAITAGTCVSRNSVLKAYSGFPIVACEVGVWP